MKRFFMLLAVVLCSAIVFSSCKKDENNLNYDEVLRGKWLVESISPALEETYIVQGSEVKFNEDYTFVLDSKWGNYFKATTWATSMDRDTHSPYLIMLGMDNNNESHVVLEGRINLSSNDVVYLDCDDAFVQGYKYTFKLVRLK